MGIDAVVAHNGGHAKNQLTLGGCLYQTGEHKCHVVTRVEAVPEGTCDKGRHAGAKAGLLAPRRYAQVDVIAQPVVRVHVPPGEVAPWILGGLYHPRVDVLQTVPRHLAGDGIDTIVAQPGENAGAFRQSPHAVVLESRHQIDHVHDPDAMEQAAAHVRVSNELFVAEAARQGDKEADPDQATGSLKGGRSATARDLALFPHWWFLGRVDVRGDVKHGCVAPAAIFGVVKCRAGEQAREEEDVGREVENRRQVRQGPVPLQVGQLVG